MLRLRLAGARSVELEEVDVSVKDAFVEIILPPCLRGRFICLAGRETFLPQAISHQNTND